MYRVIFLALMAVLIPALAGALRSNPRLLPKVGFAIGFLPFFITMHLYVAPYAWFGWIGPTKGFEISALDGVALAVILATKPVRTHFLLKVGFGIYFAACLFAAARSLQPVPSLFYVWQLLRIMVLFMAVARATAANGDVPISIVAGLGAAVLIQFVDAGSQIARGAIQAGGTVGHQNLLGVLTNFSVMSAFALLLANRRSRFFGAVVFAGGMVVLFGASRASLGLFGVGLIFTLICSIRDRRSSRKFAFGAVTAVALLAAVPVMMWAVNRRPEASRESSNEQRDAMIRAAKLISEDHPFGVGPNLYVYIANLGGYSERAGVAWSSEVRGNPVHNSYYLTLAEAGFFGLFGLIFLFGSFFVVGFRALRNPRIRAEFETVLGLFAGVVVAMAHAAYEWVSISYQLEAVMAIGMGAVMGTIAARRSVSAPTSSRTTLDLNIRPSPVVGPPHLTGGGAP